MSIQTLAPAVSPYARDPFYAMGVRDAYDEHQAGENVHDLQRRAHEMLDAASRDSVPADLYVLGYATTVVGLMNSHIAQTNAESEVAQTWLARKQGRETSTLHTRHHNARKGHRS